MRHVRAEDGYDGRSHAVLGERLAGELVRSKKAESPESVISGDSFTHVTVVGRCSPRLVRGNSRTGVTTTSGVLSALRAPKRVRRHPVFPARPMSPACLHRWWRRLVERSGSRG